MRISRRFSLAIASAVAASLPVLGAAGEAAPLVRLSLVDLEGLPPDVAERMAAETAAVLGALGARVEVRRKQASDIHDPRDLLVVVMPGDPGPLLERGVLGAVQRDAPTRALWVFPRTVRKALGRSGGAALAQALGRVVAHEVVHLACPWREHDRRGLMAARMSRATLRGQALELPAELRRDFVLAVSAQADRPLRVARTAGD